MSRIQELIDSVEGGVCKSIDELCRESLEVELEELTKEELSEIDQNIFTCDQCGWTMSVDDLGDREESDGFLCRECEDENKNEEDE